MIILLARSTWESILLNDVLFFFLSLGVLGERQPLSRVNEWLQYRLVPLNNEMTHTGINKTANSMGDQVPPPN